MRELYENIFFTLINVGVLVLLLCTQYIKNGNNGLPTKRLETYSVNIMQSLPIINGYYHLYTRTIMT